VTQLTRATDRTPFDQETVEVKHYQSSHRQLKVQIKNMLTKELIHEQTHGTTSLTKSQLQSA